MRPSQRQKTRWPGGAPLTARSVHTLQCFFQIVFFVILQFRSPWPKLAKVPDGTRVSDREWVMNEAPLDCGQAPLPGRAKRNSPFVFLCALVSLCEEILHAKPQSHQGVGRKGRRWIESPSRLPEVPCGTRSSDREWAMNEAPLPGQVLLPGRANGIRLVPPFAGLSVPSRRKMLLPPSCLGDLA
ncbi:hypothetical protein Dret_0366 [Desulfohalobium retbaense DSM 5692]|uniref:Uncharacterized protein n=1 Tax=Desulfohalobium retbaense (strain ATCC 49708 / DSM 5692 / JCM 16813 / HR100) TaxID=485915 RepID=C8X043_DESRD|nr:hypothetical protein Dret_0366 [Desulfohalobium retbaense DSM 5692]